MNEFMLEDFLKLTPAAVRYVRRHVDPVSLRKLLQATPEAMQEHIDASMTAAAWQKLSSEVAASAKAGETEIDGVGNALCWMAIFLERAGEVFSIEPADDDGVCPPSSGVMEGIYTWEAGGVPDPEAERAFYEESADEGDGIAALCLGDIHFLVEDFPANTVEAKRRYTLATSDERSRQRAWFKLSLLHLSDGEQFDLSRALVCHAMAELPEYSSLTPDWSGRAALFELSAKDIRRAIEIAGEMDDPALMAALDALLAPLLVDTAEEIDEDAEAEIMKANIQRMIDEGTVPGADSNDGQEQTVASIAAQPPPLSSRVTLADSSSFQIYHVDEAVLLINKSNGGEWQIADHHGDPTCAVIAADGTWFAVGGEGVTLFDFDRGGQDYFRRRGVSESELEPEFRQSGKEYWGVHDMRLEADGGCRFLFDPWSDYASVWRLNIAASAFTKLRDGPSLKDEPWREGVDF